MFFSMYREKGDNHSQLFHIDNDNKYTKPRDSRKTPGSGVIYMLVLSLLSIFIFIKRHHLPARLHFHEDQIPNSGLSKNPHNNNFRKPSTKYLAEDICMTDIYFHEVPADNGLDATEWDADGIHYSTGHDWYYHDSASDHSLIDHVSHHIYGIEEAAHLYDLEDHNEEKELDIDETYHNGNSATDHSLLDHVSHYEQ